MATEIARFKKSESEQIVISLNEYKSKKAIDVRMFYKTEDGNYLPSPKGVRIPIAEIHSLLASLTAAEIEAKKQGWL